MSFDETTTLEDVDKLFEVFAGGKEVSFVVAPVVFCIMSLGIISLASSLGFASS